MEREYKTLFVDWNGTLSTSKFWGHMDSPDHPQYEDYKKLQEALFQGELTGLVEPWMNGQLTTEDVMAKVSDHTNLPYEFVIEEFIKSCKEMDYISEQVVHVVKALQENGVKVVVATDNMDSFDRWTVPSLEIEDLFDEVLNSYSLGARKGDFDENGRSLFFDMYMNMHNVNPSECALIDDSLDKEGKIQGYGIDYYQTEPGKIVERLQEFLETYEK